MGPQLQSENGQIFILVDGNRAELHGGAYWTMRFDGLQFLFRDMSDETVATIPKDYRGECPPGLWALLTSHIEGKFGEWYIRQGFSQCNEGYYELKPFLTKHPYSPNAPRDWDTCLEMVPGDAIPLKLPRSTWGVMKGFVLHEYSGHLPQITPLNSAELMPLWVEENKELLRAAVE